MDNERRNDTFSSFGKTVHLFVCWLVGLFIFLFVCVLSSCVSVCLFCFIGWILVSWLVSSSVFLRLPTWCLFVNLFVCLFLSRIVDCWLVVVFC